MVDLLTEVKQSWLREDYAYLDYLRKQLADFNKLYLNNIDNNLCCEANRMIIDDIKSEMEKTYARLHLDKKAKRSMVYRLEGDK